METPINSSTPPRTRREARLTREAAQVVERPRAGAPALPKEEDPMVMLQRAYEARQAQGGSAHATAQRGAGETDSGSGKPPAHDSGRRRRWPWIVLSIVAVLILLASLGLVFLLQAMQVRDDLQQAKAEVGQIVPLVKAGDITAVNASAERILDLTSAADETVSNPLWQFVAALPFVGENVTAVGETTKATHVLVRDAMPIALELLAVVDVENLKLQGGGINLQPFRDAQPQLPTLRAAFDEAKAHVDRIDRDAILPFVDENIGQLVDVVDQAGPALSMAEEYLPRILSILGGDGDRTYALLFQNNAESRATGGNPGSGAVLAIVDGHVEMREDRDVLRFAEAGRRAWSPQSMATESEAELFEDDTARYSQNYTRTPDFGDTARLFNGLWSDVTDGSLDGVISVDPVMLSYMLRVAGPVQIEGESQPVTADNAVSLLLSESYERFGTDGDAADAWS